MKDKNRDQIKYRLNNDVIHEHRYSVYKCLSDVGYYGYALVAADSAKEANAIIKFFQKTDYNNKCDSRGYTLVDESDLIEGIFSSRRGIIEYGICFCDNYQ